MRKVCKMRPLLKRSSLRTKAFQIVGGVLVLQHGNVSGGLKVDFSLVF